MQSREMKLFFEKSIKEKDQQEEMVMKNEEMYWTEDMELA